MTGRMIQILAYNLYNQVRDGSTLPLSLELQPFFKLSRNPYSNLRIRLWHQPAPKPKHWYYDNPADII